MTDSDLWPRCLQYLETVMHILRDCEVAIELWERIVKQDIWHRFASVGLLQWLKFNMETTDGGKEDWHWPIVFS